MSKEELTLLEQLDEAIEFWGQELIIAIVSGNRPQVVARKLKLIRLKQRRSRERARKRAHQ